MPKTAIEGPIILAIDPGKDGAMVIRTHRRVQISRIETYGEILGWMRSAREMGAVNVYLENVHAGPEMASSSAFKFGRGIGALEMACCAAGLELVQVAPQTWQKFLGLTVKGRKFGEGDNEKKIQLYQAACRLFPHVKVTRNNCDALLISQYAYLMELP